MLASAQLDLLDGFAGPEQAARRAACAQAHARAREAERELEALAGAGGRARARDRPAGLRAGRDRRGRARRGRGARAAGRARAAAPSRGAARRGVRRRAGDRARGGRRRRRRCSPAGGAALDGVAGRRRARSTRSPSAGTRWPTRPQDLGRRAARATPRASDGEPGALEAAEERLAAVDRLKRKHGGTIAGVLEHAERCRARHAELERRRGRARAGARRARRGRAPSATALARQLRAARAEAAPRLRVPWCARRSPSWRWRARGSRSRVSAREPGPQRRRRGRVPARAEQRRAAATAMREAASGGELSRVMLALLGIASDGSRATLVFDEIDAGIGGKTARAVGARLRALAERPPGALHHAPAAGRLARRAPLLDREGPARRARR